MKYFKGHIIVATLLFLFIIGYNLSAVSTAEDEYTIIRQFGKVERVETEPGLSFKTPFIQNTLTISKSIKLYDMAPSSVITRDKKMMVADCFVLWRVENPEVYLISVGASKATAEGRIDNIVYNSLKNVVSSTNQEDVITGRDGKLVEDIVANIGTSLEQYGIKLVAVETKQLDLPDENKYAVYKRMVSERENIFASYIAQGNENYSMIENETNRQVRVIISRAQADAEKAKAEGEAEYMRILSEAYSDASKADFYNYVRSLDALKVSLEGSDSTIILNKDNPIVRILNGEK